MTSRAKRRLSILAAILVLATIGRRALSAEPANRLVIHADQGKDTISKNLYGHFSEHLGHCIYEGIWVGEASSIPNTRGIRNDIVAAPETNQDSGPALAWRLLR